jgi:hypothetical protein
MKNASINVCFDDGKRTFEELKTVLNNSSRIYRGLTFTNCRLDEFNGLNFLFDYEWKSIKLAECQFRDCKNMTKFLENFKNIEELETKNNFRCLFRVDSSNKEFFCLPKLKSFKGNFLLIKSPALKTFKLTGRHQDHSFQDLSKVLESNSALEDIPITYKDLDRIFKDSDQIGLQKALKKLHVKDQSWKKEIGFRSSTLHFLSFLKSQKDSIEQLTVDWFMHKSTEDDLSIKIVSAAFENFGKIQKLTIVDNLECLRSNYTKIDEMNVLENPNITELYLRCQNKKLAMKLVEASPNLRKLFVRHLDQELLEFFAQKLKRVVSICALVVQLDTLSNEKVQFENLQRINFISCSVKNHPEIQQMSLNEAKNRILSMIKVK